MEEIKLSREEAEKGAKLLIDELDVIFEKSIRDWSEQRKYTNVKVKKTDIFSLMHYEGLNYVQAVRILNAYHLGKLQKEHLDIIESANKQEKDDRFWKTLYLLIK